MDIQSYVRLFNSYARKYYTPDEQDQKNIELKEKHSLRVLHNAAQISDAQGGSARFSFLVRLAALFHDIGRFEQYRRFRTFKDDISVDHARLGFEVLREKRFLEELFPAERRIVLTAVLLHNRKILPPRLREAHGYCVRVIRDADKLDIIPVLIEHLNRESKDHTITLGLADEPGSFSPKVLKQLRTGNMVTYTDMTYVNDFKLLLLSWVYGLNFSYSFTLWEKRDYVRTLIDLLPAGRDLEGLEKELMQFVHSKMEMAHVC